MIVCELERGGRENGAVAEEGPALGATEAFVKEVDEVREDVGGIERDVFRVSGCRANECARGSAFG